MYRMHNLVQQENPFERTIIQQMEQPLKTSNELIPSIYAQILFNAVAEIKWSCHF